MCKYESINITPSENDGFVIKCRAEIDNRLIKNSVSAIVSPEEKTFVAKDIAQAMKLLKGMLSGDDGSDDDKSGMMKNAY